MTDDPAVYPIENRGYGRAIGTLILPPGQFLTVSHEVGALELNNVLLRDVYAQWQEVSQ